MAVFGAKHRVSAAFNEILSRLPLPESSSPVFIVGCGRSGTTIFGTLISRHNDVCYLNERRDIWISAYKNADVWTKDAKARGGRLALSVEDESSSNSLRLRKLFYLQSLMFGGATIVEKLPANNFRLEWIDKIFPGARYIHIYRNGLDVAASIAKLVAAGGWYGVGAYKWQELSSIALSDNITSGLLSLCDSPYKQGLLEWRLSSEAIVRFFDKIESRRHLEVSYSALVRDTTAVIDAVLSFMGLPADTRLISFAESINDKSQSSTRMIDLTDDLLSIGGDLLPQSFGGDGLRLRT